MKKATTFIALCIICTILAFAINSNIKQERSKETAISQAKEVLYTVKPGDTLWGIAQKNKCSWMKTQEYLCLINEDNPSLNSGCIYPGDVIILK